MRSSPRALPSRRNRSLFVSSNRWDVMGAAAFGFHPFWVNRAKMPDEYPEQPPLRVIADLSALASAAT